MRKILLLGATMAVAAVAPAVAWTTDTTSTTQAQKQAQKQMQTQQQGQRQGQQATAASNVIVNTAGQGAAVQPPQDRQTAVSSAIAPSFGSFNPCVGQSASMAAQAPVFGLSVGGQTMDHECQMLRLGTMGDVVAARYYLCLQDRDIRMAYKQAGMPCPADMPPPAPVVAAAVPPPPTAPARPEWCYTASPAELRRHRTECRA
jgi:type II secretory pathway pseudopilin PulG